MSLGYLTIYLGSYETIATLKSSLLEALTVVLTSNIEIGELIQGLDNAITHLESSSSNQLETRESLVRIAFDYLLKFKALQISSTATGESSVSVIIYLPFEVKLTEPQLNNTLTLAHFAGRATSSLLGYQGSSTSLSKSICVLLQIQQLTRA